MKIVVEGCAHGALDNIYECIRTLEEDENVKVDLLICCGDFQSVRNESDLRCMAVPAKYYDMCSFYKYYSGEKEAPVLTIFVGGNHEASNYLQELPYGGWVAPKIYYLGYAGVVNIGGLRIAGISGIYKGRDYMSGHHEVTPYSENTKRSVYHVRNVEVFRLKQLSGPIDVFVSHDWPSNITKYGRRDLLFKRKPFLKDDAESGRLGSLPCQELLEELKPKYWFAAHLHCKFAAHVEHDDGSTTRFLALDKCLPNKRFLQLLDVPHDETEPMELGYDLEWLTILQLTDHLFSLKNTTQYMPTKSGDERWQFTPTPEEKKRVRVSFRNDLTVPSNFRQTAPPHVPSSDRLRKDLPQPPPYHNAQTTELCSKLGIPDPNEALARLTTAEHPPSSDTSFNNTTFVDDTDNDTTMSPIKRTSMVLPKPVLEDEEVEVSQPPKAVHALAEDEEEVSEAPKTHGKKFKRRNADIYRNDDG